MVRPQLHSRLSTLIFWCSSFSLNSTEFAIFVCLVYFLLPKDLLFRTYLSSLQFVLCRVAAVKRLSVRHAYYTRGDH